MGAPGQSQSNSSSIASATYVRYAPYIEKNHANFLNAIVGYRDAVVDVSPYSGYTDIEVNDVFFGAGNTISSFTSLYELYGTKLSGLDIDALWSESFDDTLNDEVIDNLAAAERDLLDDEIECDVLPQMYITMREANAVQTSTFVMGKASIEKDRVKQISQYNNNLRYNLIPDVQEMWKARLNWNKVLVGNLAALMQLYYSTKINVDSYNQGMDTRNVLWPFSVLEHERAALSVLQGAMASGAMTKGGKQGNKDMQRAGGVLSAGLSGAAVAAELGGTSVLEIGLGAVVGMAAGYLSGG